MSKPTIKYDSQNLDRDPQVTISGFGKEPPTVRAITGYTVIVGEFEWEIAITITSRQDGKTAYLVSLVQVDGDVTTRIGLVKTSAIDHTINREIYTLTADWVAPINGLPKSDGRAS